MKHWDFDAVFMDFFPMYSIMLFRLTPRSTFQTIERFIFSTAQQWLHDA